MKIRKFQQNDRNSLIKLLHEAFPDDSPHNRPFDVIQKKLAVDDLIFVATHQDEIIGSCIAGYDGHRGWLYSVGVAVGHRRRGVGQKLVRHAIEQLQQLDCIKINLQIRAGNTEVAAFYQALGFAVEDRLSMGILLH